jgi:hypothetical protein
LQFVDEYPPVLDFAVAVSRLKFSDKTNAVQFLGIETAPSGKLQSMLMANHKEAARLAYIASLEQGGAPHVLANYHSHATPEASAYLHATAKSSQLTMEPGALLLGLKRRFRFPICEEGTRCKCRNNPVVSIYGTHFLSGCALGNERIGTHDAMLTTLNSMCKSAGLHSVTEARNAFLLSDPTNGTRPDLVITGLKPVNVVCDVKITETDTKNLTMAEAKKLNRAVLQGEYEKDRHFRAPVMAQGKVFVPASFSTSGGYGPKFKQFFTDLVKHSAEFNSIPAAALTHYWHRRFSVTLHNAVANNFFKHLGRANVRAFSDESRDIGTIVDQCYMGATSVSNRRGRDY